MRKVASTTAASAGATTDSMAARDQAPKGAEAAEAAEAAGEEGGADSGDEEGPR